MRQAVGLQPNSAFIWHDLGLTCLEAVRIDEAVAALRRAVALKPDFAHAFWRLGVALEDRRDVTGAVEAYRKAVDILPSLAEAQFRLGVQLEDMGHRTEAIKCFARAKAHASKGAPRVLAEARGLMAQNRDVEAERVLTRGARLEPKNASIQYLLGTVFSHAGRFEEAATCFEQSLSQSPGLLGVYYELARCQKITPENRGLIDRMRAALDYPGADDLSVVKLYLGIGKAHDDLGEYEQAMAALDSADAVRGRLTNFNVQAFESQVENMIALFTPDVMSRAAALGNPDQTPVLIVGMPRSGTTLCEQIVSSHPKVAAGGELAFWGRRGGLMEAAGDAGLAAPFIEKASADCLDFLRRISPDAARVSDKNPFNFAWVGLIHLAFPRAAIIHCRRSPIDTALSIHQTFFGPAIRFPTGGQDLVAYYRGYERLMAHWRRVLPPDRLLEVDYEALTAAPEPIIRDIVNFIGLEWDDACLSPERNDRVVKTPSKWQVKQPIYRTAVDRWRRYQPFLGPLAALAPE